MPRRPPTASSSSMKMIAGSCLRATANSRLMRAAPRPANISTNEAADWAKNCAPDSLATAFASSVLPVPGGPCSRIPLGTWAPSAWKDFGSRRNSTISCSSALASSTPAMSAKVTAALEEGLICCGLMRGITFSVRNITKMITVKNTIIRTGSQLTRSSGFAGDGDVRRGRSARRARVPSADVRGERGAAGCPLALAPAAAGRLATAWRRLRASSAGRHAGSIARVWLLTASLVACTCHHPWHRIRLCGNVRSRVGRSRSAEQAAGEIPNSPSRRRGRAGRCARRRRGSAARTRAATGGAGGRSRRRRSRGRRARKWRESVNPGAPPARTSRAGVVLGDPADERVHQRRVDRRAVAHDLLGELDPHGGRRRRRAPPRCPARTSCSPSPGGTRQSTFSSRGWGSR